MKKSVKSLKQMLYECGIYNGASIEDLDGFKLELDKIIQMKKRDLARAPEGFIKVNPHGKSFQFYHRTDKTCGGKYIKKSNVLLVKRLLQKRYDKSVIRELEKFDRFVCNYIKCVEGLEKIQNSYSKLPIEIKKLITPLDISDEDYKELWLEEVSKKTSTNSYPIDTDFYTDNGEKVRSKSELNIANLLKKHGLLYKYELPVKLDNYGTIYPDFTVLDVKRRRVYYWEHRGLMDNEMYAEKAVKRLRDYEKNGIFLGEQLIITEETSGLPLGTRTIEDIIKHYFY